jgi:hypothetical protein
MALYLWTLLSYYYVNYIDYGVKFPIHYNWLHFIIVISGGAGGIAARGQIYITKKKKIVKKPKF